MWVQFGLKSLDEDIELHKHTEAQFFNLKAKNITFITFSFSVFAISLYINFTIGYHKIRVFKTENGLKVHFVQPLNFMSKETKAQKGSMTS